LWRHPWNGGNGSTTPTLGDGAIIVGSPDGVTAFRPVWRDGVWSTEPAWQTKDVTLYTSNPVLVDGVLYGLSTKTRGQYFAIDAASGATLWLGEPRAATNTAWVKNGATLFLLNDDGQLIVAKANRARFEPIVRYTVADSATWAQPALVGDRMFVKDVTSLSLWTVPSSSVTAR
jgi:outer membrane protein assembly factor BamB